MNVKQKAMALKSKWSHKASVSLAVASMMLFVGCAKADGPKYGIIIEPTTEKETIQMEVIEALQTADQNTDYNYVDITEDMLALIDGVTQIIGDTTPQEEKDASAKKLLQTFHDKMPEFTEDEFGVEYFLEGAFVPLMTEGLLKRESFECPAGIALPAQDAANQAAFVIKNAFAPNCTIEQIYAYYSDTQIGYYDRTVPVQKWTVLLVTTLETGDICKFCVLIDAVDGTLQYGECVDASATALGKVWEPLMKDNYEQYATETLEYLKATGLSMDETIEPLVVNYMTISQYAMLYTTTTGDLYQALLYTDGSLAIVVNRTSDWGGENAPTPVPVEDMINYEAVDH